MRHKVNKSRLSLSKAQRKALIKALARSIIINGRIKTTKERAKNAKPLVEHLISLGKDGSLPAKREAYRILQDHSLVSKLFKEIALKFKDRAGGYSRILLFGRRRGDGTEMALFELSEIIKEKKPDSVKREKAKAKPPIEEKIQAKTFPKKPHEIKKKEELMPLPKEKPKPAPEEEKKHRKMEITDKKKTHKKFLGGLRSFFKKERDSL